jgi:glycogen debranching enzyme
MVRTVDKTHTILSYIQGSLKNVTIVNDDSMHHGFIFSLLNPPVPLGGNIVSLDIYIDEIPVSKKSIYIATSEDVVNASILSEDRPISFKPFQSARFLVINEAALKEESKHKVVILSKLEGFEQIIIPFAFTDYVDNQKERIFIPSNFIDDHQSTATIEDTIFKNFTVPLILSGKKAYIVCSSNGGLSANWTWMGARYDNGGLYVPPARAFGRIIVEISIDDGVRKRLPNFVISSRHENGILDTRHEMAGLQVKRTIFVPVDNKGFIMILEFNLLDKYNVNFRELSVRNKPRKRKIRVHFIIDGNITSYSLAAISQSNFSKLLKTDNCLQIETSSRKGIARYFGTIGVAPQNLRPSKVLTDSFDNDLELSYDLEIESGKTREIALVAAGSFNSSEECLAEYRHIRDNYRNLFEDTKNHFKAASCCTLQIAPGAKQEPTISKLIKAFEKAKTSMEYLKAEYDELGAGICAGLPRFPNYWARDTGWSLRGYLSMCDYDFVFAVLENFFHHQAKRTSAIATKGEFPMIISGKSFLHNSTFGSADSTFLFPWAIREYSVSTGNVNYLRERWKSISDLINFGFLKDIDGDGLIEHGFTGTAEKLPIKDSTWMDHIDRRKSANDIQALFYESLKIGAELAKIVGDISSEKRWLTYARQLQNRIELEYWDEYNKFYYDTIHEDGSKDCSVRPNALVLLLTDVVTDKSKAESVLTRIEKEDITTPWGVRTLSNMDPKYHPTLYHDGAVWPLVTGWCAASEIKYDRKEQALYYIGSMAERILFENGMFAETYRGDRPEPFNSCILQAWSVAMYVHLVREMMLGMKMNMIENKIQLEPHIPESLRDNSLPINFEHQISRVDGIQRLKIVVNPSNEKISVIYNNPNSKLRPEIFSNSYSLNIECH